MSWSDPEGYTSGGIMLCKLGSHDLALLALGKAVDGGYTVTEPLLHDPWLAPLRDNPRFAEILQRAQARRDEALAGFRAESYGVSLDEGMDQARALMDRMIERDVRFDIVAVDATSRPPVVRHLPGAFTLDG